MRNNPLKYVDPEGRFFETFWDVGSTIADGASVITNTVQVVYNAGKYAYASTTGNDTLKSEATQNLKRNASELAWSVVDTFADAASSFVPFVPAGLTKLVRQADNLKDAKPVVIGETMERVRKVAKQLNAETYEPVRFSREFNLKILDKFGAKKLQEIYLKRNVKWINDVMAQGRKIIDIGKDHARKTRSQYYKAESKATKNYSNKETP